jgi:hypothetical protein
VRLFGKSRKPVDAGGVGIGEEDSRPLLFLDIDGTLSPYPPQQAPFLLIRGRKPKAWVDPQMGEWITRLSEHFAIVWVSSWREEANTLFAKQVVGRSFPLLPAGDKLSEILKMAGERPFAWVDDRIGNEEIRGITKYKHPTLIISPDRDFGIAETDVERLMHFAETTKAALSVGVANPKKTLAGHRRVHRLGAEL